LQSITLQSTSGQPARPPPGPGRARDEPGASTLSSQIHPGRAAVALGHPLRVALLGLLSRQATVTATEAARELGESSGACSFHLRQLARYGHVEAVPGARGRARPWRLAAAPQAGAPPPGAPHAGDGDEFGALARELENEGYRRWLAGRDAAPPGWRDEAFSTVLHLTPDELAAVAAAVREVIAPYADRPAPGPGAAPVAVVARMFPLLPASSERPGA
jgi:hypothetical protein